MAEYSFESAVGNLSMDELNVKVTDKGPLVPPHTVIQYEDDFEIVVDWKMSGGALPSLGGVWVVELYYEGLGGGNDGQFADSPKTVTLSPFISHYETEPIAVPGKSLPVGTYRLVTVISHQVQDPMNPANPPFVTEMQAFTEGPIIRVYKHS